MEAKLGCGEREGKGTGRGWGHSEVSGSHQEAQRTAGSSQSQTVLIPYLCTDLTSPTMTIRLLILKRKRRPKCPSTTLKAAGSRIQ